MRLALVAFVALSFAACSQPCDPNGIVRCGPAQGYQAPQGGAVLVGMSKDQVVYAWGRPLSINRLRTAYGEREQWVYGPLLRQHTIGVSQIGPDRRYVYFEGDRVVAIQD